MNESDNQIVGRVLKGDSEAFGILVGRYYRTIYRVAYAITRDPDEAKDVVQNAFLSAYQALGQFKPQYRFFSWLYRIAQNTAIQAAGRRREAVAIPEDIEDPAPLPDQAIDDEEMQDCIADALMELTVESRLVIVLRHFADLTYRELSWVLDIPEKTVKSRLFDARRTLATILVRRGVAL